MRLQVLHLSDLHLNDDNPVLEHVDRIVDAGASLYSQADACLVLLTGDIADTGAEDEYLTAIDLLDELRQGLSERLSESTRLAFFTVPGNHDCNFASGQQLRSKMVSDIVDDPTLVEDEEVVNLCTEVQDNYRQFEDLCVADLITRTPLLSELRLEIAGEIVSLIGLNTSWMSRLHEEPGQIVYPPDELSKAQGGDIVITSLHHPYPWLEPDNRREVRDAVEKASDIILTGHEHDPRSGLNDTKGGHTNLYLEGGVLQQHEAASQSSFNVIEIDSEDYKQRYSLFTWADNRYRRDRKASTDWEPCHVRLLEGIERYSLTDDFSAWLTDPGIDLTHPNVEQVTLSDVFVYPDLTKVRLTSEQDTRIESSQVLNEILDTKRALIAGEERSGKTTLAKRLFLRLKDEGVLPVYLDGESFDAKSSDKVIDRVVAHYTKQYQHVTDDEIRQIEPNQRAIIIDDFDALQHTATFSDDIVTTLSSFADYIIYLADDVGRDFTVLEAGREEAETGSSLSEYRIHEFSYYLRERLAEKWLLIGDGDEAPSDLARRRAELRRLLNTIVGENFVPSYPVFLLPVLQAKEASVSIDRGASTHGYFYELLIRTSLARGQSTGEYDIRRAYLSYVAFTLYKKRKQAYTESELRHVHDEYENTYDIELSFVNIVNELLSRNILHETANEQLAFRYDYIYNYFVARYIADHITEDTVRAEVERMAEAMYVDEYAHILLFIAHLSNDPFVINTIRDAASLAFADVHPVSLEDDVEFLDSLQEQVPQLILVDDADADQRRRVLRRREEIDDPKFAAGQMDTPESATLEELDLPARLNYALRGLQVLGQIAKNFPGSIKKGDKKKIVAECYSIGRRVLGAAFSVIESGQKELVEWIADQLREAHPGYDKDELVQAAKRSLFGFVHVIVFGVVKRVSRAVGSEKLERTYDRLTGEMDATIVQLFDRAIKLEHGQGFPTDDVVALAEALEGEVLPQSVLKSLVIEHLYLYPVDFKLRSRICDKLDIPRKQVQPPDETRRKIVDSQ